MRPVLLALAGDSASGKSTLSRGIEFVLGSVAWAGVHRRLPPVRPRDARRARGHAPGAGGQPDGSDGRAPARARRGTPGLEADVRPRHGRLRARGARRSGGDRDRRGAASARRSRHARRDRRGGLPRTRGVVAPPMEARARRVRARLRPEGGRGRAAAPRVRRGRARASAARLRRRDRPVPPAPRRPRRRAPVRAPRRPSDAAVSGAARGARVVPIARRPIPCDGRREPTGAAR